MFNELLQQMLRPRGGSQFGDLMAGLTGVGQPPPPLTYLDDVQPPVAPVGPRRLEATPRGLRTPAGEAVRLLGGPDQYPGSYGDMAAAAAAGLPDADRPRPQPLPQRRGLAAGGLDTPGNWLLGGPAGQEARAGGLAATPRGLTTPEGDAVQLLGGPAGLGALGGVPFQGADPQAATQAPGGPEQLDAYPRGVGRNFIPEQYATPQANDLAASRGLAAAMQGRLRTDGGDAVQLLGGGAPPEALDLQAAGLAPADLAASKHRMSLQVGGNAPVFADYANSTAGGMALQSITGPNGTLSPLQGGYTSQGAIDAAMAAAGAPGYPSGGRQGLLPFGEADIQQAMKLMAPTVNQVGTTQFSPEGARLSALQMLQDQAAQQQHYGMANMIQAGHLGLDQQKFALEKEIANWQRSPEGRSTMLQDTLIKDMLAKGMQPAEAMAQAQAFGDLAHRQQAGGQAGAAEPAQAPYQMSPVARDLHFQQTLGPEMAGLLGQVDPKTGQPALPIEQFMGRVAGLDKSNPGYVMGGNGQPSRVQDLVAALEAKYGPGAVDRYLQTPSIGGVRMDRFHSGMAKITGDTTAMDEDAARAALAAALGRPSEPNYSYPGVVTGWMPRLANAVGDLFR